VSGAPALSIAYRWFCKLGIEDAVPDHSAFSRARNERFREGDVFRRMFERVVEACIAAGLVGGEGFAVDASLIQADANKQRSIAIPFPLSGSPVSTFRHLSHQPGRLGEGNLGKRNFSKG
jgi:hypothetical protein